MKKTNLLGFSKTQMESMIKSLGGKAFGGRQLFKWLYKTRQYDFELMTDLGKEMRKLLSEKYIFTLPELVKSQKSKDGTIKYLLKFEDDQLIETVLIPEDESRTTVCISSQVGCALDCDFCATGKMGFKRNLTIGEIIGQLLFVKEQFGENAFTNIVMMGMGEPLLNYDNVLGAIEIIMSHEGLNMSFRKFTLSTAGISPKIRSLADKGIKLNLAISLHSAIEAKRQKIMPIAKKYDLNSLKDAIRYYTTKTKSQVMFEYILFEGFNDKKEDIKALGQLFHGLPCKINILAYNPIKGLDFKRPSEDKLDWFGKELRRYISGVTVRKSRGRDINAACGQLAGKNRN
jgi:23S rRNA (adenine2503-C2)-methyltransferase